MERHPVILTGLIAAALAGVSVAQTIPNLPAIGTPASTDLYNCNQGGVSYKCTASQVASLTGSSTQTSDLETLTDSVTGNLNGSGRPDTLFINRSYNAVETVSAYNVGGMAIYPYLGYGQSNANTTGSVALVGASVNVYNMGVPSAGRSEITPLAFADVPILGGTFAPGQNFYYDFNAQSTPASGQEGFLAGGSFAVQKWSGGNVVDATHNGSFGVSIVTTPNNIGFDGQSHLGQTTYPLNAGLAIVGWSGAVSSVAAGGQLAAATAGANVGLQIGGPGGSVWNCSTCFSYFPIGLQIQDFTTEAIHIGAPNAGHTASGIAILADAGAGTFQAIDGLIGGNGSHSGIALTLQNTAGTCTLTPTATTATFSCSSDENLKSDIIDAPSQLDFIRSFRVRSYTINATGDKVIGVIAQETRKAHPEMVHEVEDELLPEGKENKNGTMLAVDGVNPWALVKAIQEIDKREKEDRREINKLKKENILLKARLTVPKISHFRRQNGPK